MVHEVVFAKAVQGRSATQSSKPSSSETGKQDLTLKRGLYASTLNVVVVSRNYCTQLWSSLTHLYVESMYHISPALLCREEFESIIQFQAP